MPKTLFILNDPPYGTERSYNALRLAGALSKREGEEVKIFLIGDAASCAKAHQKVPPGYYNVEVMLRGVAGHKAEIGVCGTCIDARGIGDEMRLGVGASGGGRVAAGGTKLPREGFGAGSSSSSLASRLSSSFESMEVRPGSSSWRARG